MTRGAFRSIGRRAALSAVLAYALVLQAFLLSFGNAAHAASVGSAQEIVCAFAGASGSHDTPARGHDGLCCVLGCHGSGGPAVRPPVAAAPGEVPSVPVAGRLVPEPAPLRPTSAVLPVGSRAPPRLG